MMDTQLTDIITSPILPIFEFNYIEKNKFKSTRSISKFINQEVLNIPVTVLLKIQ